MSKFFVPLAALLLLFGACSSDSGTEDVVTPQIDPDAGDDGGGDGEDDAPAAAQGSCGPSGFDGTITQQPDGDNAGADLTGADIEYVAAFSLGAGSNYTVYLADYDLGAEQEVGSDTITAADGQVVVTLNVRHPDFEQLVVGETYPSEFAIVDSGAGATGSPDEPVGSVTFTGISDDQICFDYSYVDTPQTIEGSVSAEVVGGF